MNKTDMLKDLRAATQAGMKDCKEALEESNWDFQKAVDIVKVRGLNVVSGREGRVASEGVVQITIDAEEVGPSDRQVAMVEVNCQTDFVAGSKDFKEFVAHTGMALMQTIHDNTVFSADVVEEKRRQVVSTTKENVVVRRWWVEQAFAPGTKVFHYLHANKKIGVLLTMQAPSQTSAESPEFKVLGDDLAMQIAAMSPVVVSSDRLDSALVERQKNIFETQLTELNKPQAAWAKILEGKFNKWYTEVCLLNQESVVVPKTTVQQVLKNVSAKLGGDVQVVNFVRCQVGEGLMVEKQNLADEVAKLTS